MAANILVVDDNKESQELLASILKQEGFRLIQVFDAMNAMKHINSVIPDLIILDWMLSNCSGIELLRRIKLNIRSSSVPVIMLSSRISECDKEKGLDSGADDYITKPFSPRELIARIRTMLRRFNPKFGAQEIIAGDIVLQTSNQSVKANCKEVKLRPTEFRLLYFFMTNLDQVFSRAELLDAIWSNDVEISERTVDVQIRRLRQALEPSGNDNLIQSVRGVGYRFSLQL